MKKLARLLSVILVLSMVTGLFAACGTPQATKTTEATVTPEQTATAAATVEAAATPKTYAPDEILELDIWTPLQQYALVYNGQPKEDIVEDAIAKITGVKITKEIKSGDIGDLQRFNLLYASGELPALMMLGLSGDYPKIMDQLEKSDSIYHFTDAEIQQLAPDIWGASQQISWEVVRRPDGKQAGVITGNLGRFGPQIEERYADWVNEGYMNNPMFISRHLFLFRDDILKAIFPNAKTEAEIEELMKKDGKLSYDDISIPELDTMDGFFNFLYQVKEKFGDEVTPWAGDGEIAVVALKTTPYATWNPITMEVEAYPNDKRAEFTALMEKINQCYRDGIIDKGYGIEKKEQRDERIFNGDFAVVVDPSFDLLNASMVQKEKPFRYRPVYVNATSTVAGVYNGYATVDTARAGWLDVLNKKKIKQEDVARVLGYLNYFATDDGFKMVAWGPAESGLWTEKDGKREWVSQDFKDVILGVKPRGTIKDHEYYGIAGDITTLKNYYWRLGIGGDNPYSPTVKVETFDVKKAFGFAYNAKYIKGFIDFPFYGWNSIHPTNGAFWAQWGPMMDEITKATVSTSKEDFDKYMAAYYDIFENKAQFGNLKAEQTKDFLAWQKQYKDFLKFHPDADLSKLN